MRRVALALAAAGLVLGALAGCGPEGQSCKRAGDVKVQDGKSYTCTVSDDGPVWQ